MPSDIRGSENCTFITSCLHVATDLIALSKNFDILSTSTNLCLCYSSSVIDNEVEKTKTSVCCDLICNKTHIHIIEVKDWKVRSKEVIDSVTD